VLFQHGNDQVGKQPLGLPREIREDDQGARFEVDLFDGVPELILGGLRAGAYGASFQFSVRREDWVRSPSASPSNPDGIPERTVREARVMEFGPVTFPAYTGSTAAVRSLAQELGEDGELRGAAFRLDDAMRRIADGYRMVTPIRPYHLDVNGKRETLRPGTSRLALDHEVVRKQPHRFRPADPADTATRSRLRALSGRTTSGHTHGQRRGVLSSRSPFRLPAQPLQLPRPTKPGRVLP